LTAPTSRTFHVISGRPQAGSTLTAAILRQNPHFHAGMSSPVASLFDGVIAPAPNNQQWSTRRSAHASCAACSTAPTPTCAGERREAARHHAGADDRAGGRHL